MVGIVVVSHSDALARGVVLLAREMSPPDLALEAAGGIGEEGLLGTSAELVGAAIERAMSTEGVLVLMDLGSALMSAELAVELLGDASGPVRLSAAPLVEGTVAAAAAAGGGATLDQVAAEAEGALRMKAAQIGSNVEEPSTAAPRGAADAETELPVQNAIGLHARPAARLVETVNAYDAEVLVAKTGSAQPPTSARSLTNVVAMAARRGDTVRVLASGPQAAEVVAALRELAASGFGEGVETPSPRTPPSPGTVLQGLAASAGVALGIARRLEPAPAAAARVAGSVAQELALLEQGREVARQALSQDRERLLATAGADEAAIFGAHLALLDDAALLEPAREAIAAGAPAEGAITQAAEQVAAIYRRLDDPLLAERATDVFDVARRVASAIGEAAAPARSKASPPPASTAPPPPASAAPPPPASTAPPPPASAAPPLPATPNDNDSHSQILVAGELSPSDSAGLDRARVAGIATAHGSATAHAAIIARALGIPAVLGLGDAILAVPDGTPLLVDGGAGQVTVAPAEAEVAESEARAARARALADAALEQAGKRAMLASGERIEVFANIGGVPDAELAVEFGAEGVGLLRTEFLFLDRAELPGEQEQAATLRQIAETLGGRVLVMRTLDAGADKPLPALPMQTEANPFLGVRGVRVGLRNPELLATQLRAALRVAAEHPLKLMLPMVASLAEITAVRRMLDGAREETGIGAPLELGIMVEVPAAALLAAELAPHVDFFSIGTNDLTQYTMAAERGNAQLASLLTEPQPAVLRLVQATVDAAQAHGRWVGVCGELAGDPAAAALLVGLGVTELSMAPRLIPDVKQALRGVDLKRARAAAELAVRATSAEQARAHGLALLS